MDERYYRPLMWLAIAMTVMWVAWSGYAAFIAERTSGDGNYLAGNSFFDDEMYVQALGKYQFALNENPEHIHALRGKARSLLQMGDLKDSLNAFNEAVAREPEFAASYANRGIVLDRLGRYQAAIKDYEKALSLNPELVKGPSWLTRFFRNQANAPPSIADRSNYLTAQLSLPYEQRLLKYPQEDDLQRPYKR